MLLCHDHEEPPFLHTAGYSLYVITFSTLKIIEAILVHWNPKSLHSNQILVYSMNDFYFCVDSIKSFGTLEKEALRSKR